MVAFQFLYDDEQILDFAKNIELEEERDLLLSLKAVKKNSDCSKEEERIMFWRLQKVGSSTIFSILLSYGYRYNILPKRKSVKMGRVCMDIKVCGNLTSDVVKKHAPKMEKIFSEIRHGIVLSHEICNAKASALHEHLSCAFKHPLTKDRGVNCHGSEAPSIKELFLVREPLSRAISVYYFWGELFKLRASQRRGGRRRTLLDLSTNETSSIEFSISEGNYLLLKVVIYFIH